MSACEADLIEDARTALVEDMARLRHDPLGFVRYSFPWGSGVLKGEKIREWQADVLREIGVALRVGEATATEAVQLAVASGHGIGKSALVAWIILWAMSTFEDCRGVVTANTENQLKTKTWSELAKWYRMSMTQSWFKFTATALFSVDPAHEKTWRVDMVPWSESNTEAFAGLHNQGKRVIVIYDEGSAIPDPIWEVTEGALTDEDTEIVWAVFGNPTRNQGRFFRAFNDLAHRWRTRQIDSRTVPGTNKRQINQWVEDHGENSDFVRVRVRGQFPSAAAQQLIPMDLIDGAMRREQPYARPSVAILGVDVARGGGDSTVIRIRLGRDARQFPPIRMKGASTTSIATVVIEQIDMLRGMGLRCVVMVDGTGGYGGNVVDKLRELGYEVIEVMFSANADNPRKYFNKRTEMYCRLREWLKVGYLDPDDQQLKTELTAISYMFHKDKLALEPKEVIKDTLGFSPDDADALAITFAYPVEEMLPQDPLRSRGPMNAAKARREYNPFGGG